MKKEPNKQKYIFWIIALILVIVSFMIIRPFLIALITGFILAYLLIPLHNFLSKRINKNLAAAICILLIIVSILLIFGLLIGNLISQANNSLFYSNEEKQAFEKINSLPLLKELNIDLTQYKDKAINFIIELITSNLSTIFSAIIGILITIVSTYYILTNWEIISAYLKKLLPFKNKEKVFKEIAKTTNHIVYGYFLIAILEFLVGLTGFYLSGVKYFLLLPLIMGLLAFIPGLGPGLIWVPTAAFYFFNGNYPTAIGVLITGLIISILIEAILSGKIIGKQAKINPLIILLGILGGVPIFGIFGFIIGPLILVYAIKIVEEIVSEN